MTKFSWQTLMNSEFKKNSQYELMSLLFYWFRLSVFQYVRDILQVTVFLDLPVE